MSKSNDTQHAHDPDHVDMFVALHNKDGTLHEAVEVCSCQLDGIKIQGAPKGAYAVVIPMPQSHH